MASLLTKSVTLASALYASPTSLAFTTSSSLSSSSPLSFQRTARPSTLLFNDASSSANDEGNGRPRRPFLASSQQEEELNGADSALPELPSSSANTHPFSELDDVGALPTVDAEPRSSEFGDLEPRPPSAARLSRLDDEARSQSVYVQSGTDGYWDLQEEIVQLEEDLQSAVDAGVNEEALDAIRGMLRRAQARDPAHVYRVVGEAAKSADRRGDEEARERYEKECRRARGMLPQFNLEGLWVGKYGSHGFEMINVTYSGDTLVAYKVTGDKNIPRGEISFTADLSPHDPADGLPSARRQPAPPSKPLEPIQLSDASARKWGTRRLPRFPGQGHAAEPGYRNSQFLDGQLVVIGPGDYFSFAWVPLEHQIFFGRPSPELTLKMLREGGGSRLTAGTGMEAPGADAGRREMAEFAGRCWEVTADAAWDARAEGKLDPESCIWHPDDDNCYFE